MSSFGRKYRVILQSGGQGVEVTDLHCKFEIVKAWAMQPNMTTCTIYNLSVATENGLIQSANGLRIEAGYENGPFGLVFAGNIIQFVRGKEDSTSPYLKVLSLDGDNFFNFGTVAFSLGKGTGLRQQVEQIASNATVPATIGDLSATVESQKLTRGKVFLGAAKDYLRDISKTTNGIFNIDNEAINMQSVTAKPAGNAVELNAESGLIGFPSQTDVGVSCKSLLNPNIAIGGLIKLNNATVNQKEISLGQFLRPLSSDGVYRVIKLTHRGDTRGNDWYTEIEGIAQGESLIPGLMPGAGANPM